MESGSVASWSGSFASGRETIPRRYHDKPGTTPGTDLKPRSNRSDDTTNACCASEVEWNVDV
jgi:hypothetical protein